MRKNGLVVQTAGIGKDADAKVPLEIAVLSDVHRFPLRHSHLVRKRAYFPSSPDAQRFGLLQRSLRCDEGGAVVDDEVRGVRNTGKGGRLNELVLAVLEGDDDAREGTRNAHLERLLGGEFTQRPGAIDEMGLNNPAGLGDLCLRVGGGQLQHEDIAASA